MGARLSLHPDDVCGHCIENDALEPVREEIRLIIERVRNAPPMPPEDASNPGGGTIGTGGLPR